MRDLSAETPTSSYSKGVGRPNGARFRSGAQYPAASQRIPVSRWQGNDKQFADHPPVYTRFSAPPLSPLPSNHMHHARALSGFAIEPNGFGGSHTDG